MEPEYREPYVATAETEAAEHVENTANAEAASAAAELVEQNQDTDPEL